MPRPVSTCFWPQVGVPSIVVALKQADAVDARSCWTSSSSRSASCSANMTSRARRPPSSGFQPQGPRGRPGWTPKISTDGDVDSWVPEPDPTSTSPSDVDRGRVLHHRSGHGGHRAIEQASFKVGDDVEIVGLRDTQKTVCTGVEMFRKLLDEARPATTPGSCCGAPRRRTWSGARCCEARLDHPAHQLRGPGLHLEEGGGRAPQAVLQHYRPQFYFRTTDVTGLHHPAEGTEMVMPGDNTTMTVELGKPIAMERGLTFAIREGGRTVGSGRVVKILK